MSTALAPGIVLCATVVTLAAHRLIVHRRLRRLPAPLSSLVQANPWTPEAVTRLVVILGAAGWSLWYVTTNTGPSVDPKAVNFAWTTLGTVIGNVLRVGVPTPGRVPLVINPQSPTPL
jgi:hypothetical protein